MKTENVFLLQSKKREEGRAFQAINFKIQRCGTGGLENVSGTWLQHRI